MFTETVTMPVVGCIVIYSWIKHDPGDRMEVFGAGQPDCPAIVLEVDSFRRIKIRVLGEHSTEVRGGVQYNPDGVGNSWRWPDTIAAAGV